MGGTCAPLQRATPSVGGVGKKVMIVSLGTSLLTSMPGWEMWCRLWVVVSLEEAKAKAEAEAEAEEEEDIFPAQLAVLEMASAQDLA